MIFSSRFLFFFPVQESHRRQTSFLQVGFLPPFGVTNNCSDYLPPYLSLLFSEILFSAARYQDVRPAVGTITLGHLFFAGSLDPSGERASVKVGLARPPSGLFCVSAGRPGPPLQIPFVGKGAPVLTLFPPLAPK